VKPVDLIYREAAPPTPATSVASAIAAARPARRPGRSGSRSAIGFTVSIGLHLALVFGFMLSGLATPSPMPPSPEPMIVALERAAPPSPPQDVPPGPQQVKREAFKPLPPPPIPLKATLPAPDPMIVTAPRLSKRSDPGPAVAETTAPPALPAPPAAQATSDAKSTWEGQVLARLEKYRRFPDDARARRQQGVVHVRFRIDRPGRVLWSRIERSSGFAQLDRAALDTLRRAQPLPAIPAERPDEVELVAPVEFFITRRQ